MADNRLKNGLKLLLKIGVTILCLWYVSRKIDFLLTWQLLKQSSKWWLIIATILFVLSKVVSSFRLNHYLRNIGAGLPERANLKLYWLGMFYNLFLPGGIGGDAYKVIVINRRFGHPLKKLSAAVVLDRISGVAGLGVLSAVCYFLIFKGEQYSWWLLAAILPGLALYYLLVQKVFPSFVSSYGSTLFLGIVVQVLQVICVYFIMSSVHINANHYEYILLFLVSSVVAILPFTIGGLGAREVVFLWGSQHFQLDSHQSIYISLLFYIITLVTSFVGIRWVYTDPLLRVQPVNKAARASRY